MNFYTFRDTASTATAYEEHHRQRSTSIDGLHRPRHPCRCTSPSSSAIPEMHPLGNRRRAARCSPHSTHQLVHRGSHWSRATSPRTATTTPNCILKMNAGPAASPPAWRSDDSLYLPVVPEDSDPRGRRRDRRVQSRVTEQGRPGVGGDAGRAAEHHAREQPPLSAELKAGGEFSRQRHQLHDERTGIGSDVVRPRCSLPTTRPLALTGYSHAGRHQGASHIDDLIHADSQRDPA